MRRAIIFAVSLLGLAATGCDRSLFFNDPEPTASYGGTYGEPAELPAPEEVAGYVVEGSFAGELGRVPEFAVSEPTIMHFIDENSSFVQLDGTGTDWTAMVWLEANTDAIRSVQPGDTETFDGWSQTLWGCSGPAGQPYIDELQADSVLVTAEEREPGVISYMLAATFFWHDGYETVEQLIDTSFTVAWED